MQNVLLIVHLILALFLIGVVLLQRSEGGALGIGGGGGGMASSRPAASPLAKVTWVLATAFIATSLALTIIAAQQSGSRSVIDRVDPAADAPAPIAPPAAEDDEVPADLRDLLAPAPIPAAEPEGAPSGGDSGGASAPLTPPAAE